MGLCQVWITEVQKVCSSVSWGSQTQGKKGYESGEVRVLWSGGCEMCRVLDRCSVSPEMNTVACGVFQ